MLRAGMEPVQLKERQGSISLYGLQSITRIYG